MPTELQKFKESLGRLCILINHGCERVDIEAEKGLLLKLYKKQLYAEDFKVLNKKKYEQLVQLIQRIEERVINEDYEDILLMISKFK